MTKNRSPQAEARRTINQYLDRKFGNRDGWRVVEERWLSDRERLFYLVGFPSAGGEESYFVEARGTNQFKFTTASNPSTFDEAKEDFNDGVAAVWKVKHKVVDCHYKQAKQFILKYEKDGPKGDYSRFSDLNTLQMMLAIRELKDEGFSSMVGGKRVAKEGDQSHGARYWMSVRQSHRLIARHFPNIRFSLENENFLEDVKQGLSRLASRGLRTTTFNSYFFSLKHSLERVAKRYPRVFPDSLVLGEEMISAWEAILQKETITAVSPKGFLERGGNHPMIPLAHLQEILDIAFNKSTPLYNYLILSLTTMMRPTEIKRLILLREAVVLDGAVLDYKSGKLVTKTSGKVDPSKLENPALSLIAKVILLYHHPLDANAVSPKTFFEIGDKAIFRKDHLKPYHERCLRTTGGHMLAFCEKVRNSANRATKEDVRRRMGHLDQTQAISVYAKRHPPENPAMTPEAYFGLSGLKRDGFEYSKYETLWDVFLLRDWLKKMKSAYPEKDMNLIWGQVIKEAKKHQNIVAPDKNGLEEI